MEIMSDESYVNPFPEEIDSCDGDVIYHLGLKWIYVGCEWFGRNEEGKLMAVYSKPPIFDQNKS